MAIKRTVSTPHGIEVKNAYCRVENLSLVGKDKIKFHFRVSVDGKLPHFEDTEYQCTYVIDGDNPIKQAYDYLKTIEKFADATDC
jgi:hypothetical protein